MVQRSSVEAGLNDVLASGRLIRYATVGVALLGAYTPVMGVLLAAVLPIEPGHTIPVLVLFALITPPSLWLLLAAAGSRTPRGRYPALVAIAVVVFGALPVAEADGIRALNLLTALVLVLVPRPGSLFLAAGLVPAPALLAISFGHADFAGFVMISLFINAAPLALLVWLAARARDVRDARQTLAREALIRERLRIDDELRQTLGVALETTAARIERAGRLIPGDPAAAAREVAAVTDEARSTLAEARRLVTRYQAVSLRAELAAAAALLSAAGVGTRVNLPEGEWPDDMPEPLRSALHSGTARLLGTDAAKECVITVSRRAGRTKLDMTGDGIPVVSR